MLRSGIDEEVGITVRNENLFSLIEREQQPEKSGFDKPRKGSLSLNRIMDSL